MSWNGDKNRSHYTRSRGREQLLALGVVAQAHGSRWNSAGPTANRRLVAGIHFVTHESGRSG